MGQVMREQCAQGNQHFPATALKDYNVNKPMQDAVAGKRISEEVPSICIPVASSLFGIMWPYSKWSELLAYWIDWYVELYVYLPS